MAYDSRTGQLVLFGGFTTTGYTDTSVWVFDFVAGKWTKHNPIPHPSSRSRATLAYDAESDRLILFGGIGGMGVSNETWVYDLNSDAWTLMHPSVSPSARYWHAMAYDDSADRIILFGGVNGFGGGEMVNNETWAYDFNTNIWTNENPSPSPAARTAHAMTYDSAARRTILHGGNVGGATWAYDLVANSWTQLAIGPTRTDPALAFDAGANRILLFGGDSSPYDPPSGDMWSFDYGANAWAELTPSTIPPHASGIPMAYASIVNRTVLFPDYYGDVRNVFWSYDFRSNAWSWQFPPPHPGFTYSFGFAYDEQASQTILFGGDVRGSPSAETWAYNATNQTWIRKSPAGSPSARRDVAMVYAGRHDRIVLFGGNVDPLVDSAETWLFDYNQNAWSNPNPLQGPPARRSPGLAYDSAADRVVLVGGAVSEFPYIATADSWTYDIANNTWANVTPVYSPHGREGHSMAYAARSGKVILFGGFASGLPTIGNETWIYDVRANNWTRAEAAVRPTPRWLASMAYDAAADRIILFGGSPPGMTCCTFFDDTWSYDIANGTWVELDIADHPGGLIGHRLAYDSRGDRILMYGGISDETWSYAYAPPVPPGPVVWYDSELMGPNVALSWLPPQDTGGASVLSYRVYRGTSPSQVAYLATTKFPSYFDQSAGGGVASYVGVTYYYQVRAVNAAGEGAPSDPLMVSLGGGVAPNFPSVLLIGISAIVAAVAVAAVLFYLWQRRRPPRGALLTMDPNR